MIRHESFGHLERLSGRMSSPRTSHLVCFVLALTATVGALTPADVAARARCVDERCGRVMVEDVPPFIRPPIVVPPVDPGPPLPRTALAIGEVRARLSALGPRVDECFDTHFEGDRAPRTYPITVFVHADGRWSLGFGPRVRAPRAEDELRGQSPLEVCLADWVSSEIGPRLQPPGGRATRRVAVSFRPHLSPVPARP